MPLIGGSVPLLSDKDETVKMDDMMADQPEPEIFERSSPDPGLPTQFQCMTPAPAFEETHLAGDQYETLTTQLDTEITASPLATSCDESRGRRFRKTRRFDLSVCECGNKVLNAEIEKGDAVMQCKVPGCETVWVSHQENI